MKDQEFDRKQDGVVIEVKSSIIIIFTTSKQLNSIIYATIFFVYKFFVHTRKRHSIT